MVRLLHIVGNMAPDGMSNFIMNAYRRIDREKLQFDFIVMGEKNPNYHEEIRMLGGKVFRIPRMANRPISHFTEIRKIVRREGYQTVFRHTDTCTVAYELWAAKLGGAKELCPHAHSTRALHPFWNDFSRPVLNRVSTRRLACGKAAGDWLYGGKNYEIIYNGIDLEDFRFSLEKRQKARNQITASKNALLVGHIGNFFSAKNHLFLLEIFSKIKKQEENAELALIGDGELRSEIIEKIKELHLENSVKLLGERKDVSSLIQGLDILVFPSLYEGLPIALIEAQASG
ncbi:MAG: glycosyltransferase, partial [Lachnospiraceae bacterium]|nr:glycosyltransferase [Lachnospiraceae bacterium]